MNTEIKICQSCKQQFIIEPEDFTFYEKMRVPAPTFCPECRLIRRLAWQGYRILYKRKCDFSGRDLLSTHPPESPHKIYSQEVWWSDKWDPQSYGRDYDFSRPFFDQFRELLLTVPLPSLHTEYSRLVDSDYCNAVTDLKNCYLVFRTTKAEDCGYLNMIVDAKNTFDVSYSNFIELSYDSIELQKCFQVFYSQDCEDSHHVWFSRDLVGCAYCIGCVNLRNKNYYIFNEPHTKEEWEKKYREFQFGSATFLKEFKERVAQFMTIHPRRSFHGLKNTNVSGDYISNSKNVRNSYMIRNAENVRYSQFLKNGPTANSYDYSIFSDKAELVYDSCWVGLNINNVKFSFWNYRCHDIEYCIACMGAGNLFGCVAIKKGEYCILNKPYTKTEYQDLIPRIIQQMKELPYKDNLGREYQYGEFFPADFCPWKYNESTAYEWYPLTKQQALARGFGWRDEHRKDYEEATMVIPDAIADVTDDILKAILKCETCGRNYRLIRKELDFYRRFRVPIPHICPFCRDLDRTRRLNPIEIHERRCAKCGKEIQTPYSPDRKEIVYCEQCYNAEVV